MFIVCLLHDSCSAKRWVCTDEQDKLIDISDNIYSQQMIPQLTLKLCKWGKILEGCENKVTLPE